MAIKIALTNLGKYNEGELVYQWLTLPATEEEIEETKEAIGINEEYEEWFITDYETEIPEFKVREFDSLERLNEQAEAWENLEEYQQEAVGALLEAGLLYTLAEAIESVESGDYSFYSHMTNERELGEYVIDEGFFGEVPKNLINYLDYEAIGRDWQLNEGGCFVSGGYIVLY